MPCPSTGFLGASIFPMSTVNEFAAAKSSDRVVVIDDDPHLGLCVASCRLSGPNVIWNSKIVSPTKNGNGDSVKISPCGN